MSGHGSDWMQELVEKFEALRLEDKGDKCSGAPSPMDIDQEIEGNMVVKVGSSLGVLNFSAKDMAAPKRVGSEHSIPQPGELPFGRLGKTELARLDNLARRLLGDDPIRCFADNLEKTMPAWITLLNITSIPPNTASSDPSIVGAFKAVDSVICGRRASSLLRRLAYVQLMRLFGSLEAIIEAERQKGRHHAVGHGNASVAVDIYIGAQESATGLKLRNGIVKQRRRAAKRGLAMSGPSPLFLLLYSDAAESLLYGLPFPRCRRAGG
ncbi:hypothetical protein BR93DRAFT_964417 [Coniochaeta sp. PMI_546]|nr:hypothetical protein BR93DRAFT_964417 [Coniochaeta sp. PMI_546]